jgi:hypothetical protein
MTVSNPDPMTAQRSEGLVLGPGEGRRIVGGSLDATVKMTLGHPALTSTFEVVSACGDCFRTSGRLRAHDRVGGIPIAGGHASGVACGGSRR